MLTTLRARLGSGKADKWFGLARIGSQAASRVLTGILIAQLGGRDVFAVYVALLAVEIIVHTLISSGWGTPIGSMAPGIENEARPAFVRWALGRARRTSFFAAGLLAFGFPLAWAQSIEAITYFGFVASTLAWCVASTTGACLMAQFRSGRALQGVALGFGLPLASIALVGSQPSLLLSVFYWVSAVGHGAAAWWMHRGLPVGPEVELGESTKAKFGEFGRTVIVGSAANSVCSRVQPFVLAATGGPVAVALFGAANTLTGPIRTLGGAVGEVLRPRLALHWNGEGDPARGTRVFRAAVGLLLAAGFGLLLVLALAGEWLGTLVFGREFAGVGQVLVWAAVFVITATGVHLAVVAMQSRSLDGSRVATRWRMVAGVVSILLVWPLCSIDGARGAFLGMTGAELVFLFGAVRFLMRSGRQQQEAARGCAAA